MLSPLILTAALAVGQCSTPATTFRRRGLFRRRAVAAYVYTPPSIPPVTPVAPVTVQTTVVKPRKVVTRTVTVGPDGAIPSLIVVEVPATMKPVMPSAIGIQIKVVPAPGPPPKPTPAPEPTPPKPTPPPKT